jgi:elongation factor 1 alpha-like protein
MKTMKIDDTPLPKSKNLDVMSEFEKARSKKNASFVVVGM